MQYKAKSVKGRKAVTLAQVEDLVVAMRRDGATGEEEMWGQMTMLGRVRELWAEFTRVADGGERAGLR